jgi:hypothetical protein
VHASKLDRAQALDFGANCVNETGFENPDVAKELLTHRFICLARVPPPPLRVAQPLIHPPTHRYDVFLFSRPNTLLAWASLPVIKLMQIRYVNDSISALAARVA